MRIYEEKLGKLLTLGRIFWIILGMGTLSVVERAVSGENQLYFSNIPFMLCSFIFCLKYPELPLKSRILKSLGSIGEKYSLGVYILHPIVRDLLKIFAGKIGISNQRMWNWCLPIIVIIFSIIMWWVWRSILTLGRVCKRRLSTVQSRNF